MYSYFNVNDIQWISKAKSPILTCFRGISLLQWRLAIWGYAAAANEAWIMHDFVNAT